MRDGVKDLMKMGVKNDMEDLDSLVVQEEDFVR